MLFSKHCCITALFLLMLPAVVHAQFNYITNGDSITITRYTGSGGAIVIPATTNGYPITTIGDFAFDFSGISSVTIPDSITVIGELAFFECTNLTFVTIPASVTTMGIGVFGNCTSLSYATFQGNAPLSDNTTFQGDLAAVYYLPGTTNWGTTFGGILTIEETAPDQFNYITNGDSITITGYTGPDSPVVIPPIINGYPVTTIGEFSCDFTSLSSLIIPPTVTAIGDVAFFNCTNLTSVTIPASVTNIAGQAFANCTDLTSAWFQGNAPPDNGIVFQGDPATVFYLSGTTNWNMTFGTVPTVEETAATEFGYVTNDDSITITNYIGSDSAVVVPDLINGYAVTSIGMNAFLQNTNLISITIPNSVTSIGDESFLGCNGLTNVIIPNSVTSIGTSVFFSCTNLNSVTIPTSVTNIGEDAFDYCISMTNIFVNADNPDYSSINSVLFDKAQDALLAYPSGLANSAYTIPNSVTTIEEDAFVDCVNLTSITVPASVTNIVGPLSDYCLALTNISVDASNPDYSAVNGVLFDKSQDTLLQYPPGLANTTYNIPNTVTTIQGDAFSFCANLTEVAIPNGVTSIGWGAFFGCSDLASIVIPNGVTNIPNSAFYDCVSLTSVLIPNSLTSIGLQAFLGCSSLTNVIIPNGVTNIEDMAFYDCGNLTSAYFQGNAPANGGGAFNEDPATVYYVPGTVGWATTYGNAPTQLWFQPQPQILTFEHSFGVQNNQFGFMISWATNASVVVQACTNLSNPVWIPVATNALNGGTNFFSDPSWANYSGRYYRISGQ